jgi:DNA-binding winged helix-turn-helix (wHTH) protein
MPPEATGRIFQFGVFEASEATGELRKHGVKIKLHSQPFKVLLLLLENPGEVVTRKDIQQRLWGNDTFVDFEHGLNAAVGKIREALNDSASQPRFVETVAGKGYRFIGQVQQPDLRNELPASLPETKPSLLNELHELPDAPRRVVRTLLLLIQLMYLSFYFGALANLQEIHEIFTEMSWPRPTLLLVVLITTASLLIPVRLFLATAVAFNFAQLPEKFRRLFPFLLPLDELWALSPILLIHHINLGLALGFCAVLVYLPFAQRSLVLMFGRN